MKDDKGSLKNKIAEYNFRKQQKKRIKEAEKLGYKKCIIPESNKKLLKQKFQLDIIGVNNIIDAMKHLNLI